MTHLIESIKEKKATIIDVRSQLEFDAEHFPGALNIPLETVQDAASKIGGMAASILGQHGVSEVYNGGGLYDMLHFAGN